MHCFPVKNMAFRAISSPLIIKKEENLTNARIILIHELIHKVITQNKEKIIPYLAAIYTNKDHEFRIHIPVLTVQKKVMYDLFNENEIKNFLKSHDNNLVAEWKEVNKHYNKFKDNIITFLKNENLE